MNEQPLKPILESLFKKLAGPETNKNSALTDRWSEIAGPRVARHTQAKFTDHGDVTVWVDDSTLAFELARRYKSSILKRLQNQFGEEKVKDIRFFVGQIR